MLKEIKTISDLTPDPNNARRHTPRNVGMIEAALHEVGAARSIVVDEDGVILAGNATVEAAGNAGIGKVQVVDSDGETIIAVRRSGLTSEQKRKLALFDNRAAELAEWNIEALAKVLSEEGAGEIVEGLWTEDELSGLLAGLTSPGEDEWLRAFGKAPLRGDGMKYMTFVLSPTDYSLIWEALERFGARKKSDGEIPRHVLTAALIGLVREWKGLLSGQ